MSGTSSSTRSATSALGIRSKTKPERDSRSSASPARIVSSVEGGRDPADPLLVGLGHDEHPAVVEDLLAEHDLAGRLVAVRGDDVHRLVEHDLAAGHELALLEGGAHGDVHLAAAREDVGGAVVEGLDDDAVGGRRLGQPVDLGLQGDDLLAGVAQRAHEALVLGGHRRRAGSAAPARSRSSVRSCAGEPCPRARSAAISASSDSRSASRRSRVPGWSALGSSVLMLDDNPRGVRSAGRYRSPNGEPCAPASPTGRARRSPRGSSPAPRRPRR